MVAWEKKITVRRYSKVSLSIVNDNNYSFQFQKRCECFYYFFTSWLVVGNNKLCFKAY